METKKNSGVFRLWILSILIIAILAAIGFFSWYFWKQRKDLTNNISSIPIDENRNISEINPILFGMSETKDSYHIGYLKNIEPASNTQAQITSKVDDTYSAVIFYNYLAEDGSEQIFYYDLTKKKQIQLTDNETRPAISPIFSSKNQLIAFMRSDKGPSRGACASYIMDVETKKIIKEFPKQEPSDEVTCLEPLSWSPDGKTLLLISSQFYLYQPETDNLKAIGTKFNNKMSVDMGFGGIHWVDDNNFIATFSDYTNTNNPINSVYEISIENSVTKIDLQDQGFRNVTGSSNKLIYMGPNALKSSDINGKKVKTIKDTAPGGDFLIGLDEKERANKIIFTRGKQGEINNENDREKLGDGIFLNNLNNRKSTRFTNMNLWTENLIGWLYDYNKVLYYSDVETYNDERDDIHLLDLITKEDKVLFSVKKVSEKNEQASKAGWVKYSNNDFDFEFEYPSDWIISDETEKALDAELTITFSAGREYILSLSRFASVNRMLGVSGSKTIEEFINKKNDYYDVNSINAYNLKGVYQKQSINAIAVSRIPADGVPSGSDIFVQDGESVYRFVFNAQSKYYDSTLAGSILSTFITSGNHI